MQNCWCIRRKSIFLNRKAGSHSCWDSPRGLRQVAKMNLTLRTEAHVCVFFPSLTTLNACQAKPPWNPYQFSLTEHDRQGTLNSALTCFWLSHCLGSWEHDLHPPGVLFQSPDQRQKQFIREGTHFLEMNMLYFKFSIVLCCCGK